MARINKGDKPLIYREGGWWRVSKKDKRHCRNPELSKLWDAAYAHIRLLNGSVNGQSNQNNGCTE
ncbi:hypothetical protein GR7B_00019 [Vibrio phage vB_VcorM_GR7B]|nr:hypothetical protein GR7B_00019 [Vibrio phage vB_VcorM_GR7B]